MPLEDFHIKQLILDLLHTPSERDEQSLIGASEIGNTCDYCLARRLTPQPKFKSRYWLGARIGTAIHETLEKEEEKHLDKPKSYHFEALEGARVEQKIVLGEVKGYGVIKSKPDLVLVKYNHLVDHKTSTKEKIKHYKLDGVPYQYVVQQNLYAWGLHKIDIPIERISLSFVPRDGLQDDDLWVHSFDYDEKIAIKAWRRLNKIWKFISSGGDIETLKSAENCYVCNVVLNRW